MAFKIVIRGVAYLVFAIALLATAIAPNHREYKPADPLHTQTAPSADSLDAGLERCKALGTGAENDASCKAAWRANRERFLNGKEVHQDRVLVPAASDPNGSKRASAGEFAAPAKRAGQPQ
jgi:conjugative transfer region protein TrbK